MRVLPVIGLTGCFATTGPEIERGDHMRTAVILLDLQRDFLEPSGRMPVAADQVEPLLATATGLAAAARARGLPVVEVRNEFSPADFIANWFRGGAAVRGTPGADTDPRAPVAQARFTKSSPDAFSNDAFDAYLREQRVDHVVIAGVFTDQCVTYTARGALNRGYRVTLVRQGTAAGDEDDREGALAALAGRGVTVVDDPAAVEWEIEASARPDALARRARATTRGERAVRPQQPDMHSPPEHSLSTQ